MGLGQWIEHGIFVSGCCLWVFSIYEIIEDMVGVSVNIPAAVVEMWHLNDWVET